MRLIITGATGLLGRNLVFEFIRKHIDAPGDLRIIALGRPSGNIALQDRLRNIVLTDGADYTGIERPALGRFFDERVSCVHADLDAQDLALTPQDRRALKRRPIDLFIHAAALTDLRAAPSVARTLHHTNVEGTRGVLKLVSELDVEEFFYIGSAYCAGAVHGTVAPDSRCADSEFRNPYERTKLEAEEVTREYARQTGLSCRTFRPSVICGRLMAPPIGATCKFDTFYVLGAFLLWLKSRITGGSADIHPRACFGGPPDRRQSPGQPEYRSRRLRG